MKPTRTQVFKHVIKYAKSISLPCDATAVMVSENLEELELLDPNDTMESLMQEMLKLLNKKK